MPWSKHPTTMAVLFEAGQKTTLIRKAMCDVLMFLLFL